MGKTEDLTVKEALVLKLLGADELYGHQLIEQSQGELERGTIYVTLYKMENKGLIKSRLVEQNYPDPDLRRLYQATPAGVSALRVACLFEPQMGRP